ncbi:MAG: hypothetical protein EZS28_013183 [Streblomastix strix]|uniref:Uncharacterized protein n=1 Tax=Streblomastix strix TaxID=222440 RepID=A0A5J4W8M7_9EUKA|nr:MAG: hypothetical protein EZS28_013183 [Streblomastix strix]
MCLYKDLYDKSSAVQVTVSGKLNMFDCEFQGTYILDNYANSINTNESASNEALPKDVESHIDEVIMKHEKQQCFQGRTQEVRRIPDSIITADGKKPQESLAQDSAYVYKYCASGMYYL